ncbi:MAG TPA: hypothetical protein VEU62_17940 [Bryobacterales bacterium]|nr:hypothetical protein [Bryobacterales bacterium]
MILSWLLFAGGVLLAQPTVSSVANNASYIVAGLPSSGIAQGSIFAVFGANMGPAALVTANSFPLPATLPASNGSSIKVTVGGTTVNAIMLYSVATQLGAILPSKTPVGDGTITVTYNNQTSATAPIHVVKSAFGTFAVNQAGSGPAIVTDANYVVNLVTNAFQPGQTVILWGTGLGPVSGDEASAPLPGDLGISVDVFVGGKAAKVTYAGRSGCCAGLDQIVFVVPAGVEGCYEPVAVRVNGVVSNFTSMAISSSGSTCSDPNSFSAADLQKAQANGKLNIGGIALTRTGFKLVAPPPVGNLSYTADSGGGAFYRFDYNKLIQSQGGLAATATAVGACTVSVYHGSTAPTDPVVPAPLDAGPVLNLSGPNGKKQIPKSALVPGYSIYAASLGGGFGPMATPLYLDKGTYTMDNGAGGADIGPFTATLNLPDPLVWSNEDSINNVPRSQDLLITWTGGDPSAYVQITGTSSNAAASTGASFYCTAQVSAGQFTVPSLVLSMLPPSTSTLGVPTGTLGVSTTSTATRFTAPGLDVGGFGYFLGSSKVAAYQ